MVAIPGTNVDLPEIGEAGGPAGWGKKIRDGLTALGSALGDKVNKTGDETIAGAKVFSSPVRSTGVVSRFGNGGDPNPAGTQHVALLASTNRTSPDKVIEQHFVGYSLHSGTPTNAGSFQGGSSESYCFANGSADWTQTVLGFEGIGKADGDNPARSFSTIIGLQGTAAANGVITAATLIAIRARGPHKDSGSATVTKAISLDIQEPTVGATRQSLYGVGAHRFRKGTAANIIEIADAADVLRWANAGTVWTGYASNGTSTRLSLDTGDTPGTARLLWHLFGSGKHLSLQNNASEVFAVSFDGKLTSQRP